VFVNGVLSYSSRETFWKTGRKPVKTVITDFVDPNSGSKFVLVNTVMFRALRHLGHRLSPFISRESNAINFMCHAPHFPWRNLSTAAHKSLFVSFASTPNPDSLKFIPEGREVLPETYGSGMHFDSNSDSRGSKLVRSLLKHGDISGVFLGRDFISVNKRESGSWTALKVVITNAIMEAFSELDTNGTPIVAAPKVSEDTAILPEDSEVVAMIKELIETRIRPAVQEDGGDIFFECVGFLSTHV